MQILHEICKAGPGFEVHTVTVTGSSSMFLTFDNEFQLYDGHDQLEFRFTGIF